MMRAIILQFLVCLSFECISQQYTLQPETHSSAVLLEVEDYNSIDSVAFLGSGFFIRQNQSIYLVTAKHVIFLDDPLGRDPIARHEKIIVRIHDVGLETAAFTRMEVDLRGASKINGVLYHTARDITILHIATYEVLETGELYLSYMDYANVLERDDGEYAKITSIAPNSPLTFDNVQLSRDVWLFGYPLSVGSRNNYFQEIQKPLVRKGIISGKNSITKRLILDLKVFNGNSGSPVFVIHEKKLRLIGIAIEYIPVQIENIRTNSGYSVVEPVDHLLTLLEDHAEVLRKQ